MLMFLVVFIIKREKYRDCFPIFVMILISVSIRYQDRASGGLQTQRCLPTTHTEADI